MQPENNHPKETWQQRTISGIFGLFAFSLASVGLGALQHEANNRQDDAIRKKLNEGQAETITVAARNDTCGALHPKLQRICSAEKTSMKNDDADTPSF